MASEATIACGQGRDRSTPNAVAVAPFTVLSVRSFVIVIASLNVSSFLDWIGILNEPIDRPRPNPPFCRVCRNRRFVERDVVDRIVV